MSVVVVGAQAARRRAPAAETPATAMVRAPRAAVARRDTVNSLMFVWYGRGRIPAIS